MHAAKRWKVAEFWACPHAQSRRGAAIEGETAWPARHAWVHAASNKLHVQRNTCAAAQACACITWTHRVWPETPASRTHLLAGTNIELQAVPCCCPCQTAAPQAAERSVQHAAPRPRPQGVAQDVVEAAPAACLPRIESPAQQRHAGAAASWRAAALSRRGRAPMPHAAPTRARPSDALSCFT